MEGCTFKFLNWEKFQGDAKRYESSGWFRLENTTWMHPLWDSLDDSEFRALMFLFFYVSQRAHKTGEAELVFKTLHRMSGVKPEVLGRTVRKLVDLGMAEIIHEHAPCENGDCTVHAPCEHGLETALRTNERTNDNAHAKARAPVFDFDSVYREYPRKKGKTQGRKVFVREIKTSEDFDALQNAVIIACDYYRQNKTDPKFIPYFSTFMSSWRDCLDPDWGKNDGGGGSPVIRL
jgi:hypothetical protein